LSFYPIKKRGEEKGSPTGKGGPPSGKKKRISLIGGEKAPYRLPPQSRNWSWKSKEGEYLTGREKQDRHVWSDDQRTVLLQSRRKGGGGEKDDQRPMGDYEQWTELLFILTRRRKRGGGGEKIDSPRKRGKTASSSKPCGGGRKPLSGGKALEEGRAHFSNCQCSAWCSLHRKEGGGRTIQ